MFQYDTVLAPLIYKYVVFTYLHRWQRYAPNGINKFYPKSGNEVPEGE